MNQSHALPLIFSCTWRWKLVGPHWRHDKSTAWGNVHKLINSKGLINKLLSPFSVYCTIVWFCWNTVTDDNYSWILIKRTYMWCFAILRYYPGFSLAGTSQLDRDCCNWIKRGWYRVAPSHASWWKISR